MRTPGHHCFNITAKDFLFRKGRDLSLPQIRSPPVPGSSQRWQCFPFTLPYGHSLDRELLENRWEFKLQNKMARARETSLRVKVLSSFGSLP